MMYARKRLSGGNGFKAAAGPQKEESKGGFGGVGYHVLLEGYLILTLSLMARQNRRAPRHCGVYDLHGGRCLPSSRRFLCSLRIHGEHWAGCTLPACR